MMAKNWEMEFLTSLDMTMGEVGKTICTKYYSANEIKKEMGEARSAYGGQERCIQGFGVET